MRAASGPHMHRQDVAERDQVAVSLCCSFQLHCFIRCLLSCFVEHTARLVLP